MIQTNADKVIYSMSVYDNGIFKDVVVMLDLNAVCRIYLHTADSLLLLSFLRINVICYMFMFKTSVAYSCYKIRWIPYIFIIVDFFKNLKFYILKSFAVIVSRVTQSKFNYFFRSKKQKDS